MRRVRHSFRLPEIRPVDRVQHENANGGGSVFARPSYCTQPRLLRLGNARRVRGCTHQAARTSCRPGAGLGRRADEHGVAPGLRRLGLRRRETSARLGGCWFRPATPFFFRSDRRRRAVRPHRCPEAVARAPRGTAGPRSTMSQVKAVPPLSSPESRGWRRAWT